AYTDADTGTQYAADTATAPNPALVGASTVRTTTAAIANTNDDSFFQSYRFGKDFGYNIALPNGTYTVELDFIETFFTSAGQRRFDVQLEGQEVISNLDLFTAAGGINTAYIATRTVSVTDGQLNLRLESSGTDDLDNAILSGFAVRPAEVLASQSVWQ
ncbi:malectin domain-containing carbohydrate-binding protein, partial [Belnapia rosea]